MPLSSVDMAILKCQQSKGGRSVLQRSLPLPLILEKTYTTCLQWLHAPCLNSTQQTSTPLVLSLSTEQHHIVTDVQRNANIYTRPVNLQ